MKTKIAALLLVAFALLTSACEQHKWEETSKLFKSDGHGEAKDEHGKSDAHGEKKPGEAKH